MILKMNKMNFVLISLLCFSCHGNVDKKALNDSISKLKRDSVYSVLHYDTLKKYTEPLSIQINNQNLITIGQTEFDFAPGISWRPIKGSRNYYPEIQEDISQGPYLNIIDPTTGDPVADGCIFFRTDRHFHVFDLSANWVLACDSDQIPVYIDSIFKKFFPTLSCKGSQFKVGQSITFKHSEFIEFFTLNINRPPFRHSENIYQLDYSINLR